LQYKKGNKKVSTLSKNCEGKNFIQTLFFYGLEKHDFIVAVVSNNLRLEASGSFETLVMNHLQDYTQSWIRWHNLYLGCYKNLERIQVSDKWQCGYVISC